MTTRYGIQPIYPSTNSQQTISYQPLNPQGFAISRGDTNTALYARDIATATLTLALFAVVVAYYLSHGNTGFNRFFNSDTFGPRFLVTGAATILAALLTSLHAEVATASTFVRLAQGDALASQTLLRTRPTTAATALLPALYRNEWIPALFATAAILAELLTLAAAGVPLGKGQIWVQFLVSSYISMGVCGVIIIVVGVALWWRIRVRPVLPRRLESLGAVMGYVALSEGLRERVRGCDGGGEEVRERLRGTRWRYGVVSGEWRIEAERGNGGEVEGSKWAREA